MKIRLLHIPLVLLVLFFGLAQVQTSVSLENDLMNASVSTAPSNCPSVNHYIFSANGSLPAHPVASAGDVNNDGYSDLIVSEPLRLGGIVYVFSGIDGDTLYVFHGDSARDYFGWSVASAGDVNNDGYSDLIVGVPFNPIGNGAAYVFSGLDGDTLYVFQGNYAGDRFGWSVASAGDVNNDGYSDLMVGAPFNGLSNGAAIVFSGLNGDTLYVFHSRYKGDQFGSSVASAGDVNNDGYSDLIIGAPFSWGEAYVFSGLDGDTLYVFKGIGGRAFGLSVASGGDVNNDGFADLIIGSVVSGNVYGTASNRAFVFSGLNGDTLYEFVSDTTREWIEGYVVAPAGDVNGDGFSDVILGDPRKKLGRVINTGVVLVVSGQNGEILDGYTGGSGTFFGHSVASAGDVDNDGLDDIIVSSLGSSTLTAQAFVFSRSCGAIVMFEHMEHAISQTELATGHPSYEIKLRVKNVSASSYNTTNGFRIFSPDGATWTSTSNAWLGGYENQFLLPFLGLNSPDGMGADTAWFAGVWYGPQPYGGLAPGWDAPSFGITLGAIAHANAGKTICLDSSWFPPGGTWKWATNGPGPNIAPA